MGDLSQYGGFQVAVNKIKNPAASGRGIEADLLPNPRFGLQALELRRRAAGNMSPTRFNLDIPIQCMGQVSGKDAKPAFGRVICFVLERLALPIRNNFDVCRFVLDRNKDDILFAMQFGQFPSWLMMMRQMNRVPA